MEVNFNDIDPEIICTILEEDVEVRQQLLTPFKDKEARELVSKTTLSEALKYAGPDAEQVKQRIYIIQATLMVKLLRS